MATDASGTREFSFLRLFPWLRLFRGIGIALDGKKILLSAVGLVLIWAGWGVLDQVFPGSAEITPPLPPHVPLIHEVFSIPPLANAAELVSDPIRAPAMPFLALFQLGQGSSRFFHAVFATLWVLLVWGVIGGAISRIAVVQLSLGERVGVVEALRFSVGKLVPLLGAPLTTFAGVTLFAALCGLMGLLYRIPGSWGAIIAGVFAFLPLLAGLVMALILTGVVAGWPLMVATVATEGEDGFDALSRSYSYVFQRPGVYAFYVALAWLLGIVGLILVSLFARAILHLALWGLAFGAPDTLLLSYLQNPGDAESTAAAVHAWWFSLVSLLAFAWIYSYFWSTAGTIYLLLRHDVDGTAWNDIYRPQGAGDPLAQQPVEAAPTESTSPSASGDEVAPPV